VRSRRPFTFEVEHSGAGILQVAVRGYLDAEESRRYLAELGGVIERQKRVQHVSVLSMIFVDDLDGFESLVVPRLHGQFFREQSPAVDRIAVVSAKSAVTFGVAVAKLIAPPKQMIKVLASVEDARRWLRP
jgi:hypothetical protein